MLWLRKLLEVRYTISNGTLGDRSNLAHHLARFGSGKLPQIDSTIGKSIREFRKGQSEEGDEVNTMQSTESKSMPLSRVCENILRG